MKLILVLVQIFGTSSRVFRIRQLHVQSGHFAAASQVCMWFLLRMIV